MKLPIQMLTLAVTEFDNKIDLEPNLGSHMTSLLETFSGKRKIDSMKLSESLLSHRIIVLGGEIDSDAAVSIIMQLLYLEAENRDERIDLYIYSPGGSITAGLAIIDTMRHIRPPVSTICIGQAYSMAAWILAAGEKGMRYALPHSEIMIHQTVARYGGRAEDIKVFTDKLMRDEEEMVTMLSEFTGQPAEKIREDIRKDYFMGASEAKQYGLIDDILTR